MNECGSLIAEKKEGLTGQATKKKKGIDLDIGGGWGTGPGARERKQTGVEKEAAKAEK